MQGGQAAKDEMRLQKDLYFEAEINQALSTLFVLFPRLTEVLEELAGKEIQTGSRWARLLEPHRDLEKAVFLDSLLPNATDAFPAHWRRFIRLGGSATEQVANAFELCFEKGYEQVIFADTLCAALTEDQVNSFIQMAAQKDLVLLPSSEGSVLVAAMHMKHFGNWDFFRFYEEGSIVEMLSDCHEKEMTYHVCEALNLRLAAGMLPQLCGKEKNTGPTKS